MKCRIFLSSILLFVGVSFGEAWAEQGCADGFMPNPAPSGTPGQNQCIPIPGQRGGDGGYGEGPAVHWAKRWGAFASDPVTSKIGVSTGLSSKRKAEKAALVHCKSKGGVECKPLLSYYNQCAAVAWGPDSSGNGSLMASSAADKTLAEDNALKNCSKSSGKCEIFFSECSFAEQVQ